jgi:hypothetical protein
MTVNPTDSDLNKTWAHGWHVDLEYTLPRLVFSKNNGSGTSICYIYEYSDIDEHVRTGCLTNLEQLEARSYYREHCIELLKKRMEDRIAANHLVIRYSFVTERGTINKWKGNLKGKGDKFNA